MHQRVGEACHPEFTEIRVSIVYLAPGPDDSVIRNSGWKEEERGQRTRTRSGADFKNRDMKHGASCRESLENLGPTIETRDVTREQHPAMLVRTLKSFSFFFFNVDSPCPGIVVSWIEKYNTCVTGARER